MKCPVCLEPELQMAERQSIEIDYCPTCRGIWLDRGELDKIIERAARSELETGNSLRGAAGEARSHYGKGRDQFGRDKQKHRRKGGLLAELFDFD